MGGMLLAVGGAISLCLTVSAALAQSADDQQYSAPPSSRNSSGRTADGWYNRGGDDGEASESRSTHAKSQPNGEQPSRPVESPRAGSPNYAPSYATQAQTQANPGRMTSSRNPDYSNANIQRSAQAPAPRWNGSNGQYGDPRRQARPMNQGQGPYYSNSSTGFTASPYYGSPAARPRTVAYNRQDVEYADDQPHMVAGPGQSVMSAQMQPSYGPPGMPGPGAWSGPEEGGCANGNCAAGGCSAGGCCDGSCSSCGCDGNGWGRNACNTFGNWCRMDAFRDFTLYAGVQGFKDPADLGENGDFGFHEGVNWGMPLWGCSGVGIQLGAEIDHSDLAPEATVFGDHRNQYFLTGGVFYRPIRECGWQGGVVWDYLDDEFYDSVKVGQIRGNLSYVIDWSEFGFEFAAGVHSETVNTLPPFDDIGRGSVYTPTDLYTLYYGRRLANGGEFKIYGGVANHLGGIVGSNLDIAISDSFSLEGDFSYVIANRVATGDIPGESVNLAFSLVWHPGCHARDTFDSAYRPLFNVADNSTFVVNRRTLP
jgi:hypothetical protein